MRNVFIVLGFLLASLPYATAQETASSSNEEQLIRVKLLGTAGGPTFSAQRNGIGTLIEAGSEVLLFDAGQGITSGMVAMAINPADVTKVFLTHLHSDHVISLPELYLYPWASEGRSTPLQVWGPTGTAAMFEHLAQAFEFDIHMRRDIDEQFSAEGIEVEATDIIEGVVYEANGVKVTAFLVDHEPVVPSFGYRVDYRGRSVVLSGDTKPSENVVQYGSGVDLLIHELGRSKRDPALQGPPDELMPNSRQTRAQRRRIADLHTDGTDAGILLARAQPKLTVFSHYNVDPDATMPLVRQNYSGRVEFGEDLMTIEIGDTIDVRRPGR